MEALAAAHRIVSSVHEALVFSGISPKTRRVEAERVLALAMASLGHCSRLHAAAVNLVRNGELSHTRGEDGAREKENL